MAWDAEGMEDFVADNKRWYKVWHSILTDPSFLDLPLESVGRWVFLGALMSAHGTNGELTISRAALSSVLRCQNGCVIDNVLTLPNVQIKDAPSDNGKITVIMNNWSKYQLDSTGYERLKRHRKKQHDNGLRKDKDKTKKREDKDKKKNKEITPNTSGSATPESIIEKMQNNPAYKGLDVEREWYKMVAWCQPRGKKPSERRFINWLNNAEVPVDSRVEDQYKWE